CAASESGQGGRRSRSRSSRAASATSGRRSWSRVRSRPNSSRSFDVSFSAPPLEISTRRSEGALEFAEGVDDCAQDRLVVRRANEQETALPEQRTRERRVDEIERRGANAVAFESVFPERRSARGDERRCVPGKPAGARAQVEFASEET